LWDKFHETFEQLTPVRKTAFFADNGIYKIWELQWLEKDFSILEIKQKSKKDPRVTLTKDTFKLMQDYGIRNALIVFFVDWESPRRFSLLTTNFTEDFKKELSSPKRFSYILWPWEKTRTPEMYLTKQISDYDDLISRFDVEVVRKDFFEKYLELYVRLYKEIKKEKEFTDLLLSQKVDIVSFAKNLLGKIVFLYFIQQKGWLWLGKKETEYGKWNKNFMRVMRDNFKHHNESMSSEKTGNFYNDYLERLFFAWLNQDRRDNDDRFPNLQMKVPYLNWGLFREDYEWREKYVARIDNNIFSNIDTKWDEADGILDIFDRYNFTVDEDSLYDSDIAVDPEMLGRIFEKMISISSENIDEVVELYDNKGKKSKIDFWKELNKKLGAFYTPREIVHYMTKESLIAYLVNNIKWDKEQNEKLIRDLFDFKEQFLLDKEDMPKQELEWIIVQVDEALKKVKILDPAVWSWAFPMWLLHEISSLRYYMYGIFKDKFADIIGSYKKLEGTLSLYKFKREIILNNIYGVDIDPWAIDIARLRFWLSLIVDEEQPEPLPNFEFKFVCANTLIPLEEENQEKDLFAQWDEPKLETLKKYKKEYYNASGNKEKLQLKERIREYTKVDTTLFSEPTPRAKQIAEFGANFDNSKHSHSFFDPSLMMSEWRGFDIVIGNPPYLEFEALRHHDKNFEFYKKYYWVNYKFNLYCMFTILNKFLLKDLGVMSYIIPNSFSKEKYNQKIRQDYIYNRSIIKIVDFSADSNVFEDVSNDGYIVYLISNLYKKWNVINIDWYKNKRFKTLNKLSQELFKDTYQYQFNISNKYLLSLKIESETIPLGKIAFTRVWLTASKEYKKIYWNDYKKKWTDNEFGFIKYNSDKEWIPWKYKIIDWGKKIIRDRNVLYKDKVCPWEKEDYIYEKIILRNRGNAVFAWYSVWELFYNDLFNWITLKHNYKNDRSFDLDEVNLSKKFSVKYILSIINSTLIQFYVHNKFNTRDIKSPMINIFPIKKISSEEQKPFIEKVDQILAITNQPWYDPKNPPQEQLDLEKEIDQMVYELYGLTDEEVKVVEESLG
jgi:hypothetical protein